MISTATMLIMARLKTGGGPQKYQTRKVRAAAAHDHRDENSRHPVHQVLDGGLAALGLIHQADDLREHHVLAHPGGLEDQKAPVIQGGPPDFGPRFLGHGHAFAGEHGFVDAARAFGHDAVHGDLFPGAHHHQVAHRDPGQGHFLLGLAPADPGGGRGQGEEAAQGLGGPAPGPGFQPAAQEDKGDNHHRGVVVDRRFMAGRGHGVREEGDPGGVEVGGGGAQGHQGVHVGGPVPGGAGGPGEERGAGVKHHRGGKDEEDEGHGMVAEAHGLRHRGNHAEPHRQAQDQGQEEAPAKFLDLGFRGAGGPLFPGGTFHGVTRLGNHLGEGYGVGKAGIIS